MWTSQLSRLIVASLTLFGSGVSAAQLLSSETLYTPADCLHNAQSGDHLLIELEATNADGVVIEPSFVRPNQLFHMILDETDTYPIHEHLRGICKNETKLFTWDNGKGLILKPIPFVQEGLDSQEDVVRLKLSVQHITPAEDFEIFNAWHAGNHSLVFDLIAEHKGVNAVDEFGQTMLMHAIQSGNQPIVASLLNTRMPKVDVNLAKSNGFTAVMYAVDSASTSFLTALLRRGGDPNARVHATGNTALHIAAMLEKTKHAELLLEYGANPAMLNEAGQSALQLLPRDSVRSTKLYFKRMFEDATLRLGVPDGARSRQQSAPKKQQPDL